MKTLLTTLSILLLISCNKEETTQSLIQDNPKYVLMNTTWSASNNTSTYSYNGVSYPIFEFKVSFRNDSILLGRYYYKNVADYTSEINKHTFQKYGYKVTLTNDTLKYKPTDFTYTYKYSINADSVTLYVSGKIDQVYYSKRMFRNYKFSNHSL